MNSYNYSYNVLINRLEAFAAGHLLIKRFTHGQIDLADMDQNEQYPFMHVVPNNIKPVEGGMQFDFQILFADIPRDKETKAEYQREVISDCVRLAQDLIAEVKNGLILFGFDVQLVTPPVIEPFVEEYKNTLTGVSFSLQLEVPWDWSACDIPAVWSVGGTSSGGTGNAYGITLKTNGVNNVVQNILDLVAGTNITITDNGDGSVTFDASGGGPQVYVSTEFNVNHTTATGNQYVVGDRVWYNGNVYACIAANDAILPTNAAYWTLQGAGFRLRQTPVDWNASTGDYQILNKPTIPASIVEDVTATSPILSSGGATPDISIQPSNLFQDGYLTSADFTAFYNKFDVPTGAGSDYLDGTGTPTPFPPIPTLTSELTNDSGFITIGDVPPQVNSDWNAVGGVAEILNKPTIPSAQGLQDVITTDPVLTTDNTIDGSNQEIEFSNFGKIGLLSNNKLDIYSGNTGLTATTTSISVGAEDGTVQSNISFDVNGSIMQSIDGADFTAVTTEPNALKIATPNIAGGSATVGQVLTLSNAGTGEVEFTTVSAATYTVFQHEIHVSQIDGNDTTGDGSLLNPVATITKALTLLTGSRKTIIVHPGTYSENVTLASTNTTIATTELTGANTLLSGTLTIGSLGSGSRISGLKMTNLVISGTAQAYISNCTVDSQVTKSSSGYVEILNSEMQCTLGIQISGSNITIINGNKNVGVSVSNASAQVIIKGCNSVVTPSASAGHLAIVDCIVTALGGNGVTITGASTTLTLINSQVLVTAGNNVAPISVAGIYSIINTIYNKPTSSLTGTSTNSIDYFQFINADKFIKQGGTASQYLMADGSTSVGGVTSVAALTIGTSGSDLSSTVANGTTTPVITLNVPTASAANRGALSSADWTTFNGKLTGNAAITGATKTKITYDAKGLVTSGADLAASDMPTGIDAANIGAGLVSNTEFGYLDGVTSAIQTQINGKQNSIGLTTVGTNLATLTNPSDIRYLRINADNTVSALTLAQLKTDLSVTDITVVLGSNFTNVGTAYEDVTGLSFAVTAGKTYKWRATLSYAATATMIVSSNGPTTSLNNARFTTSLAATTNAISNQTAYDAGAVTAVSNNGLVTADGIFRVTASGTWTIRLRCTTAAAMTVRAGSVIEYTEVL